jgi:hypothetical protein
MICFFYSFELSLILDAELSVIQDDEALYEILDLASSVDTSICLRIFNGLLKRSNSLASNLFELLFEVYSMSDIILMTSYPKYVLGLEMGIVSLILQFLALCTPTPEITLKLTEFNSMLRSELVGFNTSFLSRKILEFLSR